MQSLKAPLLEPTAPSVRPDKSVQRWRDRRLRLFLLLLRLLYFLDGLALVFTTMFVGWEDGLLGFIRDDREPFLGRVLEALTFVLPVAAGLLIVYSSASATLGMRKSDSEAWSQELRLGAAGPLARCMLLLVSALSALYLRSFDRYAHGLGYSLGHLGELHGLGFAALLTIVNAALQFHPPVGVPEVPAAAAISRLVNVRKQKGELSAAQAAAALPPLGE